MNVLSDPFQQDILHHGLLVKNINMCTKVLYKSSINFQAFKLKIIRIHQPLTQITYMYVKGREIRHFEAKILPIMRYIYILYI